MATSLAWATKISTIRALRKIPVRGVGGTGRGGAAAGGQSPEPLELGAGVKDRYKKITFWKETIDELLVQVFLESQEQVPEENILDVDATDSPLHAIGRRFFHGDHDHYCYLPRDLVRRTGAVRALARI